MSSHHQRAREQYEEEQSSRERSEKCRSLSSRNGENKYCEEYSFNKQEHELREEQARQRQVYRPSGLDETESFASRNPQLIRKYSSIYNELQEIEGIEVIHLFLEQIEENERCKEKLFHAERHMKGLEEEIIELKSLLQKKREAIRKLCETESNNLNLIECLQRQGDKKFNMDSHFLAKYRQLQNYMNEYIASTNQAQEQFSKNFKLLKTECLRLSLANEQLHRQKFQGVKQLELVRLRVVRCEQSLELFKEKERTLAIQLENTQEENASLRKDIEELMETLRNNEQFQVELTKENRELSSELDFIREKINENQSISRDIFERIEENTELNQRLSKDKEQLEHLLDEAHKEVERITSEKDQLGETYNGLLEECKNIKESHDRLMGLIDQKEEMIAELQQELRHTKSDEQQLLMEYHNQKQSKQAIKLQLMQLAEQVKHMQSTYKKQVNQHQKIKEQLQRFWQRNRIHPLKDLSNQNLTSHSLQSINNSKVSQTRTLKDSYQHQSLF